MSRNSPRGTSCRHAWLAGASAVLVLLVFLAGRGVLAGPAGTPPGKPQPAHPGSTPGTPALQGGDEVATGDLIEGLDRMSRSGQKFPPAQAKALRAALVRQEQNFQAMERSDPVFRSVLTEAQLQVIEQARRGNALKVRLGKGRPSRPGADPLVDRVVEILEKRSRTHDGKRPGT